MIVAHVGPPVGRTGGPAGYLNQLQSAAAAAGSPRHDVRFPAPMRRADAPAPANDLRATLGRIKRALFGEPDFYRPAYDELARPGGNVDSMMRELTRGIRADTAASLDDAADAAVILTHDAFSTEAALERRKEGQRIWMMVHAVMPIGLYAAWSWGVPEADWRTLIELPDVRSWIDWELGIWRQVDGLIIPCPEAAESFQLTDERFGTLLARARYLLSGASAPGRTGSPADAPGSYPANHCTALYLGSPEPYRGFDALTSAVALLPADAPLTVAVAGPDPRKIPSHALLRALGRVEDVAALLESVDFLINVNRFSLFDLSTIEAMEAGKPLLLHAAGGNRAFERLGAGCLMIPDVQPETIARSLLQAAALDRGTLDSLGRKSRACWESQLTPRHMWERHLALYDQLA